MNDKFNKILEVCEGNEQFMWSAKIISIILDCDFKDAKEELQKRKGAENKFETEFNERFEDLLENDWGWAMNEMLQGRLVRSGAELIFKLKDGQLYFYNEIGLRTWLVWSDNKKFIGMKFKTYTKGHP